MGLESQNSNKKLTKLVDLLGHLLSRNHVSNFTDTQTYGRTNIQKYIRTHKHTEIYTDGQTYRNTYGRTNIQKYIRTDKHTEIHTDAQTYRNIYGRTNIQKYIRTHKHTDTQTTGQTFAGNPRRLCFVHFPYLY